MADSRARPGLLADVRIPDANRVGQVGDGWRCARTTLMNERTALSGISLDPVSIFGGTRKDPWQTFLGDLPHTDGPAIRRQIARIYVESEV
ncbi:MAG: hypothetical protein M1420_01535 [Actinobacteria bacterium]|nr:hypothetical protein [Actinomycetota bacterium]